MNKIQSRRNMKNKQLNIDEIDKRLLRLLASNSRLSFRKISHILEISPATVAERIKKLEKTDVIKRYTVSIDYEKIGYELSAVIEITVAKGKLLEVEEKISKLSNVCAVYDVTGHTDAFIVAKFKSRKELSSFIKILLASPFIERTNTHLVLNTIKEDFSSLI